MAIFPSEILSNFSEIAERLWTGHASVMVGAGFSKNAINTINSTKYPPNWGQLGDAFYEKLYNQKPDDKVKYLSLLKLAEEFEATFGRSALEHFIQNNIADSEYEPSDVHKMLMELPWTDVFTTNYDTLLERSCKDVISRKYDIVLNQSDLVYSNKPRIIKLHGSLPSERPFVITEEDYRIYPKKYAPFVNTVQQSLLENTLCLIGFSGDDPNFLQWIGWINDNIGKNNAPKIYLIGVLNLSESQKKLLSNKNIVAVDLSNCEDVKGDYKRGLQLFITYLANQRSKRDNLEWPLLSDLKTFQLSKDKNPESLIKEWRKCREKYPNWIILPQEQRDKLWINTERQSSDESVFEQLQLFEELDYIYELNWRLEKCLFPIWNNIVPNFQQILNRYNFFPSEIQERREINIDTCTLNDIDWGYYKKLWIQLSLSLLRFYREEYFEKEWTITYDTIISIKKHLSSEQLAHFYYEQVLNAMFKMQYPEAKKLLDEWPQSNMPLFWSAKRAMLMTEFGQLKEAANLLESILTEIRKKLNLSPIDNDYFWVSQEAYVMFQLKMVQQNIRWGLWNNQEKEETNKEDFDERWNDLLQYKCDPWNEKKYFDLMLSQPYIPQKDVTVKSEFEIGRSTRTFTLGGSSKDFITAYTFLRYLEELAIPLSLSAVNIDNKTINGVIERIKHASPKWGIAILNRYRSDKVVEVAFDRRQLTNLSISEVDNYIKEYLNRFETLFSERESNPIAKAYTDKVPAVLSRLCTKCSDEIRIEIFKLYQTIYKQLISLPQLDKLFKNLIDSSNKNTLKQASELLMDTPILDANSAMAQTTFKEPFDFLKASKIEGKLKVEPKQLNGIYLKASENSNVRINAIKRLMFLYEVKQLTKNQEKRLFNIIWQYTDDDGFPQKTNYYHFAFIKWVHPTHINVESLYREYIKNNNFNIQGLRTENGIGMSGGGDRYAEELLYGSQTINNSDGVKWSVEELKSLLEKCEQWWHLDKHYLIDEKYKSEGLGGRVYDEFLAGFRNLTNILSMVFGYSKKDLNAEITQRLEILINDMEIHNVPILKAKIVFGIYDNYKTYLVELQKALISQNRTVVIDALNSVILAVHSSPYQAEKDFLNQLLETLSIPLKWRIVEIMSDIFDIIKDLINHSEVDLSNIEGAVYSSLEYISSLNIDSETISLGDYLLLKQKSISLASILYIKHSNNGNSIPHAVLEWKSIAEDENEFSDIKSRWL